jgi:hypothetical protein
LREYIANFESWIDGAYQAIFAMNDMHREQIYRQWNGRQAAEFLSLHSMCDYLFDVLQSVKTIADKAEFFKRYHLTIGKMQTITKEYRQQKSIKKMQADIEEVISILLEDFTAEEILTVVQMKKPLRPS